MKVKTVDGEIIEVIITGSRDSHAIFVNKDGDKYKAHLVFGRKGEKGLALENSGLFGYLIDDEDWSNLINIIENLPEKEMKEAKNG